MRCTPSATALQEIEREYGDILEPLDLSDPENATILPPEASRSRSPQRETSAMRAKINAARSPQDLNREIIQEWLTGCYDEHDAIYWLKTFRIHSDASTGDAYHAMVCAAIAAFGDVELPEPSTVSVPSVSRREPYEPGGGAS